MTTQGMMHPQRCFRQCPTHPLTHINLQNLQNIYSKHNEGNFTLSLIFSFGK